MPRRGPATGGSVPAAATMGALSALLVGPCMTAPLAGTLLYIAQGGSATEGALLLLSLGLGLVLVSVAVHEYALDPAELSHTHRRRLSAARTSSAVIGTALPATRALLIAPLNWSWRSRRTFRW